jgi:hypothetical protein
MRDPGCDEALRRQQLVVRPDERRPGVEDTHAVTAELG